MTFTQFKGDNTEMGLTILDYGAGNLKSLTNILELLKQEYIVTSEPDVIKDSDKLIFPGVGHFGQFMSSLEEKGLTDIIIESINSGKPFLGICLGMHVLFEESEEAPDQKGLGIFPGKVIKFKEGKVPQIGWNKIQTTDNNSVLTDDYVYFVHSYHVVPENKDIVSSYSNYHIDFTASIEHKNIYAFQFHPERSGMVGYNIIKKWLEL